MSAFVKFSFVGLLGFGVQLITIAVLTSLLHWPWLPATVVAVECAIVHNFLWHERWTWSDRPGSSRLARFARFNAAAGITSMVGNVVIMGLLVGRHHLPIVPANAAAVVLISIINFVYADRWVFAAALLLIAPSNAAAAPSATTLDAWTRYVTRTEARLAEQAPSA